MGVFSPVATVLETRRSVKELAALGDQERDLARIWLRGMSDRSGLDMPETVCIASKTVRRVAKLGDDDGQAVFECVTELEEEALAGELGLNHTTVSSLDQDILRRLMRDSLRGFQLESALRLEKFERLKEERERNLEARFTHGLGIASRPFMDLSRAYPSGGEVSTEDSRVILGFLLGMLQGELTQDVLHFLTHLELEVAQMLLEGVRRDPTHYGVDPDANFAGVDIWITLEMGLRSA